MLMGIISWPSSITCQIPPGTPKLWPLNCPKTELAVSALQVEYPAPKNVVITIEFTTNMTGIICVSLALLYLHYLIVKPVAIRHKKPDFTAYAWQLASMHYIDNQQRNSLRQDAVDIQSIHDCLKTLVITKTTAAMSSTPLQPEWKCSPH